MKIFQQTAWRLVINAFFALQAIAGSAAYADPLLSETKQPSPSQTVKCAVKARIDIYSLEVVEGDTPAPVYGEEGESKTFGPNEVTVPGIISKHTLTLAVEDQNGFLQGTQEAKYSSEGNGDLTFAGATAPFDQQLIDRFSASCSNYSASNLAVTAGGDLEFVPSTTNDTTLRPGETLDFTQGATGDGWYEVTYGDSTLLAPRAREPLVDWEVQ